MSDPRNFDNPVQLLADLVHALDNAFICTMQSTAYWDGELDAAREYLAGVFKGTTE